MEPIDITSNEEIAIKFELCQDGPWMFQNEVEILKDLSGCVGVPRLLWEGQLCRYYIKALEALGPSLEDLLDYCRPAFTLKTVLLVADQAICRLRSLHNKGYIHRDVKPSNFTMGVGRNGNKLYIIDFGLTVDYSLTKQAHKRRGNCPFEGTVEFASLNSQDQREQGCGDDLESLGYTLLYLARGSLPWQYTEAGNKTESFDLIRKRKMAISVEALCEGLPGAFVTYINYTRSLLFGEKPDYAYLRRLFRRAFISKGFKHDFVFDWTEKRFHEVAGLSPSMG
ncbi:hypothetical protein S40288_09179 [Stachybotrys chartarum IBT 40288]|nr:hypothetical protein S40288_09179 [Stachybotrys chartarum IBT 40288]